MSLIPTPLPCPHCGSRKAVEAFHESVDVDAPDALKGTSVDCRQCGDTFECYFY